MNITRVTVHGNTRWRVAWYANGKTHRKFFPSESAAKTFGATTKSDLAELGAAWERLPGWKRAALMEVAARAEKGGYTLAEACDHYEATHPTSAFTVGQLCDLAVEAKRAKGLRPESLRLFKLSCDLFRKDWGERPATEVSSATISSFLAHDDWGAWRRRGVLIDLRTLFSWGVKAGLLAKNPASGVDRPIIEDGPPVIFTVDQCRKFMLFVREKYPVALPWAALCLFGGLRVAEASRLKWAQVRMDSKLVEVTAAAAKKRERRLAKMHDTLSAWLRAAGDHKPDDSIDPGYGLLREMRKVWGGWPKNVLRHSAISYELARSQEIGATAEWAGTSPEIIRQHYRELVTPDDAVAFWKILPA